MRLAQHTYPVRELKTGQKEAAGFSILAVLLLFPSITFGVLSAEIFPWAVIFCMVFLRNLDGPTLIMCGLLILSAMGTMLVYAMSPLMTKPDTLRSLVAYFNIILIYVCILKLSPLYLDRLAHLIKVTFYCLLGLGALQITGLTSPLDGIFSALVPRASGAALLEQGGRGVTLLSSEPARAGIELTFLFAAVRVMSKMPRRITLLDLLFPIYIILVVRSASAAFFAFFVVFALTIRKPSNLIFWIPLIVGVAGTGVASGASGRFVTLIEVLSQMGSFSDALFFLANESGHRLLAFYSFIKAGIYVPYGFGVGNWREASIYSLDISGVDYSSFRYFQIWGNGQAISIRAPGVIPNLILDIGIFGILVFFFWLWATSKPYIIPHTGAWIIILILLVKITLFGSLGNPIPWVITAVILRKLAERAPQSPVSNSV